LSRTPDTACKATQKALLQIDGLKIDDECRACLTYGTKCLVGSHPSTAALTGNYPLSVL
jgi:hypothetical protein